MIKFKFPKYTKKDAEIVIFHLKSHGIKCELVGGIRDRGYSFKDIDLYFPNLEYNDHTLVLLSDLLGFFERPGIQEYVLTEVGGIYFYSRIFGEIDCFFRQHTKEYCEKFGEENP